MSTHDINSRYDKFLNKIFRELKSLQTELDGWESVPKSEEVDEEISLLERKISFYKRALGL
jgi:hypothetical protein